jgi:AraC family transcriptional regulator
MDFLPTGQFYGQNNQKLELDGLTLTDTVYSYEYVDWHYHENPHFTLITRGDIRQGTLRETYECPADTLLFHNRQEPHYNVKPAGVTRGFQLEVHAEWSRAFDLNLDVLPNCARILHPGVKLPFYNIYKEAKLRDDVSALTIHASLLEMFSGLREAGARAGGKTPGWVKTIDDLLHDQFDQPLSLQALAAELNLHWAHLSREFPRYFHCTFGAYIRKIRLEKSLPLLRNPRLSLTEIALTCGFADQSHFTRCFKEFSGVTPGAFRKLSL